MQCCQLSKNRLKGYEITCKHLNLFYVFLKDYFPLAYQTRMQFNVIEICLNVSELIYLYKNLNLKQMIMTLFLRSISKYQMSNFMAFVCLNMQYWIPYWHHLNKYEIIRSLVVKIPLRLTLCLTVFIKYLF